MQLQFKGHYSKSYSFGVMPLFTYFFLSRMMDSTDERWYCMLYSCLYSNVAWLLLMLEDIQSSLNLVSYLKILKHKIFMSTMFAHYIISVNDRTFMFSSNTSYLFLSLIFYIFKDINYILYVIWRKMYTEKLETIKN